MVDLPAGEQSQPPHRPRFECPRLTKPPSLPAVGTPASLAARAAPGVGDLRRALLAHALAAEAFVLARVLHVSMLFAWHLGSSFGHERSARKPRGPPWWRAHGRARCAARY